MTPAMRAKMEELADCYGDDTYSKRIKRRMFVVGFTAAVELMQERERVAIEALEELLIPYLAHSPAKIPRLPDVIIRQALATLKGEVKP